MIEKTVSPKRGWLVETTEGDCFYYCNRVYKGEIEDPWCLYNRALCWGLSEGTFTRFVLDGKRLICGYCDGALLYDPDGYHHWIVPDFVFKADFIVSVGHTG